VLTATLKGMVAHKLRLALTTASIALGVAFLAGTLILTDTMGMAFDQAFAKISAGTDTVVRTEAPFASAEGAGTARPPIDSTVLADVSAVPGVRVAEGSVGGYALLTDTEGKPVVTPGGAPTLGYSMAADEDLRGEVNLLSGAPPQGADQVAIDATSAETHDIGLGDSIDILLQGPTQTFTVVGIVGFGGEKDLGGTTSAYFELRTAQDLFGEPGFFDSIQVAADEGVTQAQLTALLSDVVPEGAEAMTGAAVAKENADAATQGLEIVGILFSIFAAIALFVGSFIIWNTFTMIVTQRSREIALQRAIGATRRQVLRALMTEALLIGAAASAFGVALGAGVALGLRTLMDLVGFSLPSTSLQVEPRTIWVSMVVGTLVTVVAALVPALRATKVLPVEALRESTAGAEKPSGRRGLIGAVLLVVGAAGMATTLYGDADLIVFGVGLVMVITGVMVALPALVRPLAALIAAPLRWRGLPAELAEQNAARNPRRTAAAAAALMIGLALVVSMSVFASSLKASFGDMTAGQTEADLYLATSSAQSPGFSPSAVAAVRDVPGIDQVSATGWGEARFEGTPSSYSAVDPATAEAIMHLEVSAGSLAALDNGGVVVAQDKAAANGWAPGDTVTAEFAASGEHTLRIVGVYGGSGWLADDFLISIESQQALAGPQLVTNALLTVVPGQDARTVQASVADALASHPDTQVMNQDEYEAFAGGFVDQLLTFVTIMLLLAVAIALLGIVNTLALSVFERTRELGLLRAVGMTRGQVRAMVRWESAVIALIGALTGAALGTGIGLALARALEGEGITAISVPVPQVALFVALAALAGVVAAIGPARSAAKVDVLRAVVTD
jgi:putative ABC transport system permease protein